MSDKPYLEGLAELPLAALQARVLDGDLDAATVGELIHRIHSLGDRRKMVGLCTWFLDEVEADTYVTIALACVLAADGATNEAIRRLDALKSTTSDPELALSLAPLRRFLERDYEAAIAAIDVFDGTVDLSSYADFVYQNSLYSLGRYQECLDRCLADASRGVESRPNYRMADCLIHLKRWNEAILVLRALDAQEESLYVAFHLSRLLLRRRTGGPWFWTRWREAWPLIRKQHRLRMEQRLAEG